MKKILASLALVLLMAAPAVAQTGGFTGPGSEGRRVQVSDLKGLDDDAMVTLTGTIQAKISDEKYTFSDSSGTVTLEIDDDLFKNMTVNPNQRLEIYGEVDKGIISALEVDVKRITKID